MPDLLDTPIDPAPAADPAPASDPAPAPTATAPVSDPIPATDPAAPAAEPSGIDTLPDWAQKELRSARDDAAKYRTTAKPYSEAFGKFDDPSREVLLDLINTIASDPTAGAVRMRELSDLLEGKTPPAAADPADPEADTPLTKSQLDQIMADRDKKAADDRQQAEIQREAEALGYNAGTREYYSLLYEAANNPEHKANIESAHKALEAEKAAIIKAYVEGKVGDAATTPTAGSGTGSAPANANPIKTFADASASAEQRFKAASLGK